jgi:hypothetical protein
MPSFKHTLKTKNVTLLDEQRTILKCNNCGQPWSPNIQSGGRLPRGYWKCPNRCNWEERQFKHPPEVRAFFAQRNRKYRNKKVKNT